MEIVLWLWGPIGSHTWMFVLRKMRSISNWACCIQHFFSLSLSLSPCSCQTVPIPINGCKSCSMFNDIALKMGLFASNNHKINMDRWTINAFFLRLHKNVTRFRNTDAMHATAAHLKLKLCLWCSTLVPINHNNNSNNGKQNKIFACKRQLKK